MVKSQNPEILMKNSKVLFQDFVTQITLPEHKDEIRSIAYMIFEHFFDLTRTEVLAEKQVLWNVAAQDRLNETVARINKHEPVQYIIGEADFYGRKFNVDPSVLIPRPETEELVREVLKAGSGIPQQKEIRVLDIGTGSGCIPITLALELPAATIFATDVSDSALVVAKGNASKLEASVQFARHNILTTEIPYPNLDIVVSNPPYISAKEKDEMKNNVLMFEPHLALFVPDDDPLIFYRAIVVKADKVLNHRGALLLEINQQYGNEVAALMKQHNFCEVDILKDLSGKDRIVKGLKA